MSFSFCINLNNVDLSSFDAKNVTNMFFKCENLINLEGDEQQIYECWVEESVIFAFSTSSFNSSVALEL